MNVSKGRLIGTVTVTALAAVTFVLYLITYITTVDGVLSGEGIGAAAQILIGVVYMVILGIPHIILALVAFVLWLNIAGTSGGAAHAVGISLASVNALTFVSAIGMFVSLYLI